jgi:2-methylcitrate dehydratase PrpD
MTTEPLIAQLARHLQRPVPEYVRTRARLHLLDWLACVAGARGSAVANVVRVALDITLEQASMLGNILEMDDVHRTAVLHPGPVVWPAALHWHYRSEPQTMRLALDAAVVGYEAMVSIGETFDSYHYAHWYPTGTIGTFGAAAAGAVLRELWPEAVTWALGNAGSVAGGVWHMRHDDVMTKQWNVWNAMSAGSAAANLAEAGFTGPAAILEGPQGLYAAMCKEPKPMNFTDHWRIEEVSFKPWAACRHAHPAIDCALELRAGGKLTAPFHVETYADAITFCDKPSPTTETEAKFSIQHAVAVIADGRNASPADFTPEAIAALAPVRAQVTVAEHPDFTARYPDHFGARIGNVTLIDTRGDPERPVSGADIIAKMHMLAAWGGLPASEADRAVDLALRGDDAGAIVVMLGEWLS